MSTSVQNECKTILTDLPDDVLSVINLFLEPEVACCFYLTCKAVFGAYRKNHCKMMDVQEDRLILSMLTRSRKKGHFRFGYSPNGYHGFHLEISKKLMDHMNKIYFNPMICQPRKEGKKRIDEAFNSLEFKEEVITIKCTGVYDGVKLVYFPALRGYTNLRKIVVNENRMKEIDLEDLSGLEVLICGGNPHLKEFNFDRLPNLKQLNAPGNNLRQIDVSKLKCLEIAYLGGNELTFVDLKGLQKLKKVDFSCNKFDKRKVYKMLKNVKRNFSVTFKEQDCGWSEREELEFFMERDDVEEMHFSSVLSLGGMEEWGHSYY